METHSRSYKSNRSRPPYNYFAKLASGFEVYKEMVEEVSGKSIDETNFSQLAREHRFGIVRMAEEMIVRDPIAVDGDTLVCVGEVPVGSLIYILQGDKDSLISGGVKARQSAEASYFGGYSFPS